MEKLIIQGSQTLKGTVHVSGSKNSALPIMAASLLTDEPFILRNVPKLRDTQTMMKLLKSLGKEIDFKDNTLTVTQKGKLKDTAEYDLVSTMRGSFCVLGPLLAKLGRAKISLPGGCVIGIRPVDLHIKGLKALGTKIEFAGGYIIATAKNLKGSHIYLGGIFGSSVLATANVMMAATLTGGTTTIIESAACEPEVEDLANCLVAMGAKISGQGGPRIEITGVKKLKGVDYTIIPDRIEAGTYILLAAATRNNLAVKGANLSHLFSVVDKLKEVGVDVYEERGLIKTKVSKVLKPVNMTMLPYPGLPTDIQAQFMAFLTMAPGVSVIDDKVYPDRFIHIAELNRMGANIQRVGTNAIVQGVKKLYGAPVMASDLRASAALVIAGLAAEGRTEVHRIYHLERGYENLVEKLSAVGAKIHKEKE